MPDRLTEYSAALSGLQSIITCSSPIQYETKSSPSASMPIFKVLVCGAGFHPKTYQYGALYLGRD